MSNNILNFVEKELTSAAKEYEGKHFSGKAPEDKSLLNFVKQVIGAADEGSPTKLGSYSEEVSTQNLGETAFQRALFNSADLEWKGHPISWLDIEIPVVFGKNSRRRCVDLIGRHPELGAFLCELKYSKSDSRAASNLGLYAILEVLIYLGAVRKFYSELIEYEVWRNDIIPWAEIRENTNVVVLANQRFWSPQKGIDELVGRVAKETQVRVTCLNLSDNAFVPEKYEPRLENDIRSIEQL
jgi:hypothetical protein